MRAALLCLTLCIAGTCFDQSPSERALHAKQDALRAQGTAALNAEYARELAPMSPCSDANDTFSINKCMGEEFAITQKNYLAYIRSIGALLRLDDIVKPAAAKEFDRAELSWTTYRDAQCSAYEDLDPGSIQVSNFESCMSALTRGHLHELESLYKRDLWEKEPASQLLPSRLRLLRPTPIPS